MHYLVVTIQLKLLEAHRDLRLSKISQIGLELGLLRAKV